MKMMKIGNNKYLAEVRSLVEVPGGYYELKNEANELMCRFKMYDKVKVDSFPVNSDYPPTTITGIVTRLLTGNTENSYIVVWDKTEGRIKTQSIYFIDKMSLKE